MSDWCEERGDLEAAEGLRWQAKHRKRPAHAPVLATWFRESDMGPWGDPESNLPDDVFDLLQTHLAGSIARIYVYHDYTSFEDACKALWRALKC